MPKNVIGLTHSSGATWAGEYGARQLIVMDAAQTIAVCRADQRVLLGHGRARVLARWLIRQQGTFEGGEDLQQGDRLRAAGHPLNEPGTPHRDQELVEVVDWDTLPPCDPLTLDRVLADALGEIEERPLGRSRTLRTAEAAKWHNANDL